VKALERSWVATHTCRWRRIVSAATTVWMLAVGVCSAATPGAASLKGLGDLQDIHDIRPPFHIPRSWFGIAVVAGCCVLAALVVVAWRWRQRRVSATRKSAHELALERLAQARALMVPEQAREFSTAVSGIIRSYIEARFDIQAAHRTTPEFLRDRLTQADGPLASHREGLEEFMRYCDLAKFARWVLSVPEMEAMLASGIIFVTATATTTGHGASAHEGGSANQDASTPTPPDGFTRPGIPASPSGQLVSQTEAASS
jgi:hypothetical protein